MFCVPSAKNWNTVNSPPDFLPIIVDEPNGLIVILVAVIFYIADNDFSGVSGSINQKPLSMFEGREPGPQAPIQPPLDFLVVGNYPLPAIFQLA